MGQSPVFSKEEPLGIADAELFTDWLPFLFPSQQH